MMNTPKRILSLLLTGAMLASVAAPTWVSAAPVETASVEEAAITGEIAATLRLDYPQTAKELAERNVRVELLKDGVSVGALSLGAEKAAGKLGVYPASVTLKNQDGGTPAGEWLGSVDVRISGLPLGTYQLKFTGNGYCSHTIALTLTDYSRHVTVGTGDATFTLGDFDADNKVTEADRVLLAEKLGSKDRGDLADFDLNGDGEISVIDLSYVSRNIGASGGVEIKNTALLNVVDLDATKAQLERESTIVKGNLADLFRPNGQTVSIKSSQADDGNIVLPITLSKLSYLEAIQINTPEGAGEVENGWVTVQYDDGETEEIPFGSVLPEDIHALSDRVITINLGRRVAVKEITITVVKEAGQFVTIESIQFLEDIVPENPVAPNSQVQNVEAVPGSEQVNLTWAELPNVSGYRVDYWPKANSEGRKSLTTNGTSAVVSGLKNNEMYCFTVTPVDGTWQGTPSAIVEARPIPASAPSAPDMVRIDEQDGALAVSWKKAENTTYYKVFYQVKDSGDHWTQAGGQLSSTGTTISGLTNGTTYSVYVIAGNAIGESGHSRVSEGTPKTTDYSRPAGIPTEGLVTREEIESIRLAAPGNVNSSISNFTTEYLLDNDYRTHWTAKDWSSNEHIICTFKEPMDLSSAIWVPRMDGQYPNWLRVYSVTVWYEGENLNQAGHLIVPDPERGGRDDGAVGNSSCMQTWPGVRNNPSVTRFAVLPFGPVEKVKQISVAVEQVDYNLTSCSELMFLKYDREKCLPDEIAALFADELRTELAPGVTKETITALQTRLNSDERNYYLELNTLEDELNLAQELLEGKNQGVVIEGIESRSAVKDSQTYSQSGSELQPLGVAAGAGSEITIYADGIPDGQKVTVFATQFNAEANTWSAKVGAIGNGRNVLTIPKIGSQDTPRGGSLYITYSGTAPENIKLHVRRGTDIPMLNLSNWYSMTEEARSDAIRTYTEELSAYVQGIGSNTSDWKNVTEIATPTVLLSLAATATNNGLGNGDKVAQLTNSVLAWEDLLHICKTTQGIDKTYGNNDMQSRQNIRCMQMFSGAFMYAAGNHIGIGYNSCAGMVGGKPIDPENPPKTANSLFGWGIAHEIGHNMDKLGKAEITNNIYSIMAQTYDGAQNTLTSRLESSKKYPAIFQKVAQGTPGASNDVFVQLGMYWQLHLAYDDGTDPMAFYNAFFKAWKKETYFNSTDSYDDKVALTAAGVARKDLTEFFTRWGMQLSEGTPNKLKSYSKESRAIWYLNDQSRRDRLNGVEAMTGEISVSAAKDGDKTVKLSMGAANLSGGSLQGYEILRSDSGAEGTFQSIAFTSGDSYEDVIGSANHRTYTYKVVAYDTLGNMVGEAVSAEIRIAYDKTVEASEYTIVRGEDGSATITLNRETSISGIKLSGENRPTEGAFTVTITDADDKTSTARSGDFSQNNQAVDDAASYLTYFQKPGVEAEDTRIWTYDAKTVTITGLPSSLPDENIQLIRYAGDDVSFLEEGFAGVLSQDYVYGDGEGQTIPAGTLVVLGTYRGNPVYQTIRIEGQFSKTAVSDKDQGEGDSTVDIRPMNGKLLLFAEIPEDQAVSDISDGFFLFIPDIQKEAILQGASSDCSGENLLPTQIRAVLYRTDMPETAGNARITAQTLWMSSPGGTDLPSVVLN